MIVNVNRKNRKNKATKMVMSTEQTNRIMEFKKQLEAKQVQKEK